MRNYSEFLLLFAFSVICICQITAEQTALHCYTCAATDDGTCDQKLRKCPSFFQACQTIVTDGKVEKGCRSLVDCWRAAAKGCVDGKCSYCCDEDKCNVDLPANKGRITTKSEGGDDNPCEPNPCANGGTCERLDDGTSCKTGKSGKSCGGDSKKSKRGQVRRRELQTKYAQIRGKSGGTKSGTKSGTQSNPDEPTDFVCHCRDGYYGPYCEDGGNPCDSHPCRNGGSCHDDGDGYWCECPNGYDGEYCEIVSRPCDSNPCHNGATCHNDGGHYWCECPSGYQGKNCDIVTNPCDPNPCHNGATCHNDGGHYWCECPSGYQGEHCDIVSNPCDSHPCRNGATCHNDGGSYWCECPNSYHGRHCESEIAPSPCASGPCYNGGTCHQDGGGFYCECPSGYEGHRCESAISSPCDPNPCLNGGTCEEKGNDNFVCKCAGNYNGPLCEHLPSNPCNPNPCENGGSCHESGDGYDCDCVPGYGGLHCEDPQSSPPSGGYDCAANNPCTPEAIEAGNLYWPHEDPSKFVQCDLFGRCYVMDCPAGLIWDQEQWDCV